MTDPRAPAPLTANHGANPASFPSRVGRALLWMTRATSAAARPLSGRRFFPLWGIVQYRGRRSGRQLAVPVAVRATPGGLVIALPFEGAQWYRNVLAAGACVVRWKGADHPANEPKIVDWVAAGPWFNPIQRTVLKAAGVDRFLHLRLANKDTVAGGG